MKKRMKKLLTEVLVISLVIGTGGKSSVYVMADEAIQNTSNGYTGNESTEDQINLDDADQSGVVKSNDKKEMNTVDFDEVSETKSSIKLIEEDISALETKESLDDTESALDENIIDSGTCGVDGDNLSWVLTSDGTLKITGTGDMESYSYTTAPWDNKKTDIISILIDNGVTSIGSKAFKECSNLVSIMIPDSVTYISDGALRGCSSLASIMIPDSVTYIGMWAFAECNSLESVAIPDSVKTICDGIFYLCSSLIAVTMSDEVTSIGRSAFSDCSNLMEITIPENVMSIGRSAFSGCSSLTSITIPENVTSIEFNTFSGCTNLTDITIPNGVTNIGDYAFNGCNSLSAITIPENVESIGMGAFSRCSSLTSITIPDSVINISHYTFSECTSLADVILSNEVTSIGESAFSGCSSLTSITIPDNVTIIGESAFSGCSSLTSIRIPNNVTNINNLTFSGCTNLTDAIISDSVTSIGDSAFSDCSNLMDITFPENVTSIGKSAFSGCSSLTSIIIPDNVTSISRFTFSECTNLTDITISNGVTNIDDSAFNGCSSLSAITIPENVVSIGMSAFSGCSSLTSIRIPDNVTSISNGTFSGCTNLTDILIPDSVSSIGDSAFSHCSSLPDIIIPDSVSSIGDSAFSHCSSLPDIIIPNSVSSIGSYAFGYCGELSSVTLSNSLTSISKRTFVSCSNLTNITIPDSVTSIGESAFCWCDSLSSVTIPDSVMSIGDTAFFIENGQMNIYYGGSEEEWKKIEFGQASFSSQNSIVHYNSTGPEESINPLYNGNLSFKIFTGWDNENEIASFSNSISYHIDENTDLSFLDILDELIGQKVLVVEDKSEIGLLKGIYPVEKIVGKVSEWGTTSIVLNGEQYPTAKDWSMNDILVDQDSTVLCYLHEGTIVGILTPQKESGILKEWNGQTNEITIDDNTYIVNTDDLTFLNSIQSWIGHSIDYILLDDIVIDVSLPDYSERYTAKVEEYNAETGEVYFTDGQSYFMSEDLKESPSDYIGKWVVYTVQTSQDQGVHLTSLELVKSEMIVTMKINQNNVFYKEGQYSFDSENFVDRSDFEIPYTVTVENRTNASAEALDQLKQDEEFDITINDMEMDIQSGFNFGWLNNGEVQSIGNGTVIHAGDSVTAEGYIKPDIWYSPEELTNTYNVFCTVVSSSGEDSSMDTITVTINYSDASTEELETAAAQALDEISDNVAMSMDDSFFDQNTTNRIADALLSIAIMAKAEPQDLEDTLTEDLFDELFGDWKLPTGAATYDVPVQIAVNTEEYGELIFEFTMHLTSFNLNDTDYGLFGSIDYSIIGGKGINDVPVDLRNRLNVGVISRSDVTAFCNAAYELAEKEIKKAYNKVTGDDLNKVADIVFGQTVKQILEENDTSFSDILFKIITTPGKSYTIKCPVDIYLYDETGELKASIVNNQIEKESDFVELEVIGDTKVITIWDGAYDLKLVSNGTGDMDITVTEYAGINNILRVVDFYDIPLGEKIEYLAEVQPDLLANDYILVDNQSEKITPDQDETILEMLSPGDPEEHVHVYGEPVFSWSEDYQTCTAVFICSSCDYEQKIECDITSETTDPTCTEEGKTVYTATVSFDGKEYADTKEEVIPATGHTYEYMDNGDGTHTKVCTAGDDTVIERHIYQDGICTSCGAEEPEEHEHVYGEPELTWSEDNQTCTAIFTCKNGDDEQKVECKVTSETTDPTCTEAGKTVYTATVSFEGKEYADTQEEVIPATGHTYEYTDNGDGTHTKVCTAGDETATEPHTYQDGICTFCGAEEPKEHVHEYGTPEFNWSEDYANCTMVFTCKDGDDRQNIECEVTDEITDATCTENGKAVYTAKGTFDGKEYTDVKEVEIPASGHAYGTPEFNWSDDYTTCTAVFICESCNDQQKIECDITSETTDPTCTGDGKTVYTATVAFEGKEYTDTQEEVITATGHTYEYTDNGDGTHTKVCTAGDDTAAEPHTYQDGTCTYCGAEEPKEHIHEYGTPEFNWSEDYTTCTAVFTCKDGDDQQSIKCEVTDEVTDATCTENGKAIYTAKVTFGDKEYTDVKEQEIPASGHTYGTPEFNWSEDYQTCTAVFTCESCDDQQKMECDIVSETTDPTCTEDGKTTYTATVAFEGKEYSDTQEEVIPAAGHTYEYIDNGDGTHTKVCTAGDDTTTEPHIYQDGICISCGAEEPEEHEHVYGEPEFTWSEDNQTCTAIFTCKNGDDEQKVECKVTSETTDPTCTESGKTVYTAAVQFGDQEYTATKEEEIPAVGHNYEYTDNGDGTHMKACTAGDESTAELHVYKDGKCTYCGAAEPEKHEHVYGEPEFTWSEDNQTCIAIFTCKNGDDEQKVECKVASETTDPTCTEAGKTVYTATALFEDQEYTDTKEEEIPAAGHSYEYTDNGDGTHTKVCTIGDDTAAEPHTYQDGICVYCGAEEPEGHVHEYGEPEFIWSEDSKNCTIVFTCADGDDQQKIECEVTSEITDATCTENGKAVYTAKGSFNGEEYSDMKEEEIPASGHAYEEPVFNWSEDYQTCTAVFTCESGDDEQSLECEVVSETTEPTCTASGKTVYTATVLFNDKEYSDTQEEAIVAAGHTYEYRDNGDGTHTKTCTVGDDSKTESHTYQEGICAYCGAEEPKEHVHEYGEPEFSWADDFRSCIAVFTCTDNDDQQTVECTVESKDNGDGTVTYTAVAEFNETSYTDTQTVKIPEKSEGTDNTETPTGTGEENKTNKPTAGTANASSNKTNNKTAIKATADDKAVSSAKTGDDTNVALWILLLAAAGATGVMIVRSKKKMK